MCKAWAAALPGALESRHLQCPATRPDRAELNAQRVSQALPDRAAPGHPHRRARGEAGIRLVPINRHEGDCSTDGSPGGAGHACAAAGRQPRSCRVHASPWPCMPPRAHDRIGWPHSQRPRAGHSARLFQLAWLRLCLITCWPAVPATVRAGTALQGCASGALCRLPQALPAQLPVV